MSTEKEKKVEMVEMELDLSEDTITGLLEYAKENILNDKDALINWAVNAILREVVETDGKVLEDNTEDGPAIEYANGSKYWYLNGRELTQGDFNKRHNSCEGKIVEFEGKKYKLVSV